MTDPAANDGSTRSDTHRFYWPNLAAGYTARRMVPDLLALGREWRPDVVVRGLYEFGGAIAAEALALPHATVQVGHVVDFSWLREEMSARLDPVRAAVGLPPDPELAMPYRHLLLSFVPPSYQEPAPPIATQHHLRTVVFDGAGVEAPPAWLADDVPRPVVYATFGTVVSSSPAFGLFPGLFQTTIAALREIAGTLVVTVGRDNDPAALGPQPAHVRVERYLPQSLLFPACDLVVQQGGHSTTLAAIAHGLPQVIIPIGADQPDNAARSAELGLAVVVGPAERTAERIGAAAHEALENGRYRANARRLQAEMAALPGPERGVELIETLAAGHGALTT